MGARKSKRSLSVQKDRFRYGLSRSIETRTVLPVVAVVCDDTKTACSYFKILKREVAQRVTVNVIGARRTGATAKITVDLAIDERKKLRAAQTGGSMEAGDSVWALVDLEAEPSRVSSAYSEQKRGRELGVQVLLSNPCFEVWTLAHLTDTGETFADCQAVLQRVKSEWKRQFGVEFGDKSTASYEKLTPFRNEAVRRAKSRVENRAKEQSWTEVYQVVEEILRLTV
ncbi:MAG: RloB domain-containing protein [Phycisphaerales bacterium]|nr:RloB domain-containing protein [Phycisphaerales bacterium]